MPPTPYPDSVRFLYSLGNEYKTIKLGLERITRLCELLGSPHRAGRFLHVAGTNGKGSTCALIEAALRAAGHSTGLYTSPHLTQPTERIRINGQPVSEREFAQAFDQVRAIQLDEQPTYFETVTAMAFLLFAKHGVDYTVLETGLGGRLDSTNIVDPILSVITPIDYDHQQFLGNTLTEIAREKAGIIKPGRPVISARQHPEAAAVLAPFNPLPPAQLDAIEVGPYASSFLHRSRRFTLPLIGEHQLENAAVALAALDHLGVDAAGIEHAQWPGRLERVRSNPDVFLDGAHNPAGIEALARYIRAFHAHRRIWLVFAAMRDKEISPALFPLAHEIIFTAPKDQPRALPPAELSTLAPSRQAATVADALRIIEAAAPEDAVFITGSLFLVGEARPHLVG